MAIRSEQLVAAYQVYLAACADYDKAHPFDPYESLKRGEIVDAGSPIMSADAHAGELITQHNGVLRAIICAAGTIAIIDVRYEYNHATIARWQDTIGVLLAAYAVDNG